MPDDWDPDDEEDDGKEPSAGAGGGQEERGVEAGMAGKGEEVESKEKMMEKEEKV